MACAIVGIGRTEYYRQSNRTTLAMAAEATRAALADAGLDASDVDGMATYEMGDTADPPTVAYAIGLDELAWDCSMMGGGRCATTAVATAAAAIEAGLCKIAVVYRSLNSRSGNRYGQASDREKIGGAIQAGVAGESQFAGPAGYLVPPQWMAMWARRYQSVHKTTSEDLGRICVTQRAHATANAHAIARAPLTLDDYMSSRWINEPLRVFDCAYEVDAAVAIVLAADDVAASSSDRPAWLIGAAGSQSRARWDGWEDLGTMYSSVAGPRLWERTGRSPADVDVACMYDCFSYTVLATMEGYGFCEPGKTGAFFADGRATYGGDVVVNPHGGLLSEGYVHGLNHFYEATLQLRGAAGPRQVADATVALVTSGMGPFGGATLFSVERP